jgi:hypothetical protein
MDPDRFVALYQVYRFVSPDLLEMHDMLEIPTDHQVHFCDARCRDVLGVFGAGRADNTCVQIGISQLPDFI